MENCLVCGREFEPSPQVISERKRTQSLIAGKLCSAGCSNYYQKEKGIGIYGIADYSHVIGENNYQWKGDAAKYGTKHDWVNKWKGRPQKCEHCGTTDPNKRYEWATISGEHKRDLNDWKRLCKKCHVDYDDSYRGLREYLKKPIRKKQSNNKSGFKNVRLTPNGKFRAYITVNKKQIHLGNFDTGEEAYEAYKTKALELYGEY